MDGAQTVTGSADVDYPVRDYRDLCIADLAQSEAALCERNAALEREREAYRLLAQEAIHALHALTCERDRLRCRLRLVVNELRARRIVRSAA